MAKDRSSKLLETVSHVNKEEIKRYLHRTVLSFGDANFSAQEIATELEYPSLRAAVNLDKICKRFNIPTTRRLFEVGALGLLDCKGCGERTLWMASHVVNYMGYDVMDFCRAEHLNVRTPKGAVRAAQAKTRRRPKTAA